MLTAAVVLLGALVLLLGLLVAGLLRSHAEILRALHDLGVDEEALTGPRRSAPEFQVRPGVALPRGEDATDQAADLVGHDPWGTPVSVAVAGTEHRTLLLFLSSGCLTCADFWEAFAQPAELGLRADIRPVLVTKGPEHESEARVRELAPRDTQVVMASEAWTDYEVPVAPYAILIEGRDGRILGEGASASWEQVRTLMHQALDDLAAVDEVPWRRGRSGRGAAREASVDAELLAAGITPGHPSLYSVDSVPHAEVPDAGDPADSPAPEGS